jgi:acyl-CoA synthetase (AMP-forming)/AMP-acid ligase II
VTLAQPVLGVPFAHGLRAWGDRPAVVTADARLSYAELADRVEAVAARLGPAPRLVLLAMANTVDSVVAYLAALAGGHPVLLAPAAGGPAAARLRATYDPDVVVRGASVEERRAGSVHRLHPELAVLLSTSGSTGSAKLVRLSAANLQANAEAIADYLGIRGTDRAATTLPLSYCYGLSVLNSHLVRGASVLLTDRSVVEAGFWRLFREQRCTTFAGVPYTFDLLDRAGFAEMRLPDLRYVTQAGGRLAPDRVRRYAELGRRAGWDLYVMYGQTEATARMAYLPPDLAAEHPECIGGPIPGGAFRLEPLPDWPDPDTGELVYSGPNVMLGYAESAADLGLGRTVQELRTGDVARRTAGGLYQVVGRRSRFVKVYGLRVDLDQVELALAAGGVTACCVGSDDGLVVAVEGAAAPDRRRVAEAAGLPPRAVRVRTVPALPRLANGKPDRVAVAALGQVPAAPPPAAPATPAAPAAPVEPREPAADLRALYAEVLCVPQVTDDDTFVGLGGDSLTYVHLSVRLERLLGRLPEDWPTTPVGRLRATGGPRWPRRSLDTTVALRAVAIVLIVGTHAGLVDLPGGAHLLLAVVGYNLARFQLTAAPRRVRLRRIGRTVGRIALPSIAWAAAVFVLLDQYTPAQVLLLNYVLGAPGHNDFWFVETTIWLLLAVSALLAVPLVDRLERRHPFALPLALAVAGLASRYGLLPGKPPTPVVVFWLVALGWAAARAATAPQRLAVTALAAGSIVGFHGDLAREVLMIAGYVLLVWVPVLPSLGAANRVATVLAGSSLCIYLTHWQVYRPLADHPVLACAASLLVGIGYAAVVARISAAAAAATGRVRTPAS